MEGLGRDLRHAARALRRSPSFALIAVLTLGLGVGANTAIYSVVSAVLLKPLPYAEPERLVALWEASGERMSVAPANLADYAQPGGAFEGVAGYAEIGANLTGSGPAARILGDAVTWNFFSVLGVEPALGRSFRPEEDRPGADQVVVLSHGMWAERFGSDPGILGRRITLDDRPREVIGVLPAGFEAPSQYGMSVPIVFYEPAAYPAELLQNRADHEVHAVARLKRGTSIEGAQADLDRISSALERAYPKEHQDLRAQIASLHDDIARDARTPLLVLLGAVGLILLIACVNVSNLLVVRALGRRREIAVRVALGAGRGRILRELLAQSAVLAVPGCAAGLLFAAWIKEGLVRLLPPGFPQVAQVSLDAGVLAVAAGTALVAALLSGLLPAWGLAGTSPNETLRARERGNTAPGMERWRSALVVAEIALALMLATGAGLLLRSFALLRRVELGFAPERVLALNVLLPASRYPDAASRLRFFEDLAARVRTLPGVEAVAFANRLPMRGGWGSGFQLSDTDPAHYLEADFQAVSPGYFETLGIPLRGGRALTPQDRAGAPAVAVVSQAFARKFLRGRDSLGARFHRAPEAPWIEVVGIAADMRRAGRTAAIEPEVYLSALQTGVYPVQLADFALRASADPLPLARAVQGQVLAIDPDQPVTNVRTLEEVLSLAAAPRRFNTVLMAAFALLALLLSGLGIYAVVSYSVGARTSEIGIRIALGAKRGDVLAMVLGGALRLALAGIGIGLVLCAGLTRFLETLLFQVAPIDPPTYAGVAILLAAIVMLAAWLPALGATRVDPALALRSE